jgi:uncharacterized membrane protein
MMRGYWDNPGAEPFAHHIGGVGVAGMILMIILWIAVIAAIVIGIRALVLHSRRDRAETTAAVAPAVLYAPAAASPAASPSLLAILEERYARGDIGREEFLQRKEDLGLAGPVVASTTEIAPESTN